MLFGPFSNIVTDLICRDEQFKSNIFFVALCSFTVEGQLNMSPQSMPLCHKGYFELIIFEKQHRQVNL